MIRLVRFLVPLVALALIFPLMAVGSHGSADEASANMKHLANLPPPAQFLTGPANEARNNSDLTFYKGGHLKGYQHIAAAGHYDGFRLIDVKDPENPQVISVTECRANQGDLSFYEAKNRVLLIQSIEEPVTSPDCATARDTPIVAGTNPMTNVASTFRQKGHEGLRVFDVTDPAAPRHIATVRTACGSHTHTTLRDDRNKRAIVYVSSYPSGLRVTRREDLATLPEQPNCIPDHNKISIVEIPDANPEGARVLKEQPLDQDTAVWTATGNGGSPVRGCHDITILTKPSKEARRAGVKMLAAGACLSEGQLWDVSDPANPTTNVPGRHSHIRNPFIDGPTPPQRGLFHTASFTYDGEVVLFTDEWAGGGAHGCDGPQDTRGNVWFYGAVTPGSQPPLFGRYILPRPQPPEDACSMHNGNVVPVKDAYIGVSSAYEAGTSVFDFTGVTSRPPIPQPLSGSETIPTVATEVAFFDAKNDGGPTGSGPGAVDDAWSSYWHNDFVYTNGGSNRPGQRGFDVYKILLEKGEKTPRAGSTPPPDANQFKAKDFGGADNPQTQDKSHDS